MLEAARPSSPRLRRCRRSKAGFQVAFMAPTEILAEQHYRKLAAWLDGLPVHIAWLSGGLPAKEEERRSRDHQRRAHLAVGRTRCFRTRDAAAPGARDRRRAAPLRRRATPRAAPERHRRLASADDERDADSAHAGDELLRRSRCLGDRPDAAGNARRWSTKLVSQKRRAEIVGACAKACAEGRAGVLGVPTDRGIGETRVADGGGLARGIDASSPSSGSACCTDG